MFARKEVNQLGLIKKVSRTEPCPICGKPDYCYWRERDKDPGLFNLYCNRTSEAIGTIVTGVDGNEYVAIFQREVGIVFEKISQREERRKEKVTGEKKERTSIQHTVLDSVSPLPHEKLDAIYRCIMEQLPLYRFHAEYLLKEGWSMELIKKHGICSFPAKNLWNIPYSLRNIPSREKLAENVMKKLSLKSLAGVPGAYIDKNGRWTFLSLSGIVFPVYDADGLIYRIRIRLDYIDIPVNKMMEDENGFYYMDGSERVNVTMSGPFKYKNNERIFIEFSSHKGKYRNFSSYKIDENAYRSGFIENVYNKGCEAKNSLVFAMNPEDDYTVFWIIEGEKKAYFSNYILHQPFIGLSGVNDFNRLKKPFSHGKTPLDIMHQRGAKIAVIAYDADRYHNEMVMNSMENLSKLLLEDGFIVYIADWNEKNGKGLDDLLSSGYLPALYNY